MRDALAPVYTVEQRQLIHRLRYRDAMTGREIADACDAGRDGVAPFKVPPTSAITIARREEAARIERELGGDEPDTVVESLRARMVAIAQREVTELEMAQRARGGRVDLGRLKAAAEIVGKLERAGRRRTAPAKGETAPSPTGEGNGNGSGFLDQLGEDEERVGVAAHPDPNADVRTSHGQETVQAGKAETEAGE